MGIENMLIKQYRDNLDFLIGLKNYVGNIDNRIHDSAMVLIIDYLKAMHPEIKNENWNVKMGSQTGTDIEGFVDGKQKVIGELKTTKPCGTFDFGAQQKLTILKDLQFLESASVENKYFFVIDSESFDIIKDKYQKKFPTLKIINILSLDKDNTVVSNDMVIDELDHIEKTSIISNNDWDIEIKLTEGPINGFFFNIPQKYQHFIQEGEIIIINDLNEKMYCNTVASMGKSRISKNLNNWYKAKKFQPGDKFYLKKVDERKFKVVGIKSATI